jgi:Retrotransposon gag protein
MADQDDSEADDGESIAKSDTGKVVKKHSDAKESDDESQASFNSSLRSEWIHPDDREISGDKQKERDSGQWTMPQERTGRRNIQHESDKTTRHRVNQWLQEPSQAGGSGAARRQLLMTEKQWRERNRQDQSESSSDQESSEGSSVGKGTNGRWDEAPIEDQEAPTTTCEDFRVTARTRDDTQNSQMPRYREYASALADRYPGSIEPRPTFQQYTPIAHSTGIGNRRNESKRSRQQSKRSRDADKGSRARGKRPYSSARIKIDPFPKDVPSSSKLSTWEYYTQTQALAMERNGVTGQREKAIELRLTAGDEIGRIIMMERLMPEQHEVASNFEFYKYLVDGVTRFFRSMSDGNINANEFQNVRQGENENVNEYATRFKMIAMKVGHVNDAVATSAFIKGLRDENAKSLASSLNMTIEGTIPMVMRREANLSQNSFFFPDQRETVRVAAVNENSGRHRSRERHSSDKSDKYHKRKRERSRNKREQSRGRRDNVRDTKRPRKDDETGCSKCGRKSHRDRRCPAIDKTCHICGERGHFMSQCKKKVREVKDEDKKVKKRSSSSSD